MKTRNAKLMDYGVPPDEEKKLIQYCRSDKMTKSDCLDLLQCAIDCASGLEIPVYDSIITGDGYRTMIQRGRSIPIGENDFYAYRRKTLGSFYQVVQKNGRWK